MAMRNILGWGSVRSSEVKIVLILLISFSSSLVSARKRPVTYEVAYGGVAVAGNYADYQRSFPLLSTVDQARLDEMLRTAFQKIPSQANEQMSLSFGKKIEDGASEKVLALVFTGEEVALENVNGTKKAYLDLYAELLVLDFKDMSIAACKPFVYEKLFVDESLWTKFKGKQFSTEEVGDLLGAALTSEGFTKALHDSVAALSLESKGSKSCRISGVAMESAVVEKLPNQIRKNTDALKHLFAAQYEGILSAELPISFMPYRKNSANSKMSLAFSNSERYNFTIPESTYSLDFTVQQFKHVNGDRAAVEHVIIYGAYIRLKVYEPESGKVYFDEVIKKGHPEKFPNSMGAADRDDYLGYRRALKKLFIKSCEEIQDDRTMRKKVLK